MKVWCKTQVITLASNSFGGGTNGKSRDSCIVIGSQNNRVSMRLTVKANSSTTDYRLTDNIINIFSRHVEQGKMTVRLCSPSVDIMLCQTDVVLLKSFLLVLQMVKSNKDIPKSLLSNTHQKIRAEDNRFQRNLSIRERHDYPMGRGFPAYLVSLAASSLSLRKFDSRIIALSKLSSLTLADNQIDRLPAALTGMPLGSLDMSGNLLTEFPQVPVGCPLAKRLQTLLLSRNQMETVQPDFWNLTQLVHLAIDNNQLAFISAGIERTAAHLRFLRLHGNQLNFLPNGVTRLRLDAADFTGNQWQSSLSRRLYPSPLMTSRGAVRSLIDIAMTTVKNAGLQPTLDDLPATIHQCLHHFSPCLFCHRWSSPSGSRTLQPVPLATVVTGSITHDNRLPPAMLVYLCSRKCEESLLTGGGGPYRHRI